jgi:putative N6-adenine-specific DNA methylase
VSDCQKIIKKAVVERLKSRYHLSWFAESAETVQIRFSIMKDQVTLCLDTSGEGLHKRGYRPAANAAPLRETLAAAMVNLARYRGRDEFADPFCGSGTIPIEAALIARNIAPGRDRHFAAMDWRTLDAGVWSEEREAARAREFHGDYRIYGSDLDHKAVLMAKANAERAGLAHQIHFEVADACMFARTTERGVIVTNPPYGERIGEKQEAEALYRRFGEAWRGLSNWQLYLLSSHTEFERCFGAEADKKRKLYNGMIKCDLFMYYK